MATADRSSSDHGVPARPWHWARRLLAATAAALDLALGALVVLGMATGTDQQFDKGVAPLWVVVTVQALGAVCLVLLALGLRLCVLTWLGRRSPHALRWVLAIVLCWLVWAFFRVVEYSS